MIDNNELSKYVLYEAKEGRVDKETAIHLVKQINVKEDIAVIGIGCKFGPFENYEEFWDVLANRKTTVSRVDKKRINLIRQNIFSMLIKKQKNYNKGSYIKDIEMFDSELFSIPQEEAIYADPGVRIMLEVAYRALEDAGYIGRRIMGSNTGVFIGNNFMKDKLFSYLKVCFENTRYDLNTDSLLYSATSGIATRLANYFDLHGPSYAVDASCASSSIAIYNACRAIKDRTCTAALAGGMLLDMSPLKQYNNLVWNFVHPDDIITRLFDNDPGGSFVGEGAAVLVLKSLDKALEDGDHIHGIISGESINNNGSNGSYAQSSAEDIKKTTIKAIKNSRVRADEIGMFVGEGYPYKLEEGIELSGVISGMELFTRKKQFCALSGISNVGYLQSCIGAFNIIACLLAFQKKQIPPGYHFIAPTDIVDFPKTPFYVNDMLQNWECGSGQKRHAMVESYGFGGGNLIFILDEAPEMPSASQKSRTELFMISAKTEYSFYQGIIDMIDYLKSKKEVGLTDICHAALTKREHYSEYRLCVVADRKETLISRLSDFSESQKCGKNVYYGKAQTLAKKRKIIYETTKDKSLEEIAMAYCNGSNFKLEELFEDVQTNYCKLPGYAFDRKEFWCHLQKRKSMAYYKQKYEL